MFCNKSPKSNLPNKAEAEETAMLMGGLLSSISGGIPGEEEADKVVDPPLDDRDESPFGPLAMGVKPTSSRRGEGGETDIGVAAVTVVDPLVLDTVGGAVIMANVAVRFF